MSIQNLKNFKNNVFLLKTRINHLIIKENNLLEIKNIHIFRESWGESTKIAVEYFIKLNKKDLVLRGIELNLLLNICHLLS